MKNYDDEMMKVANSKFLYNILFNKKKYNYEGNFIIYGMKKKIKMRYSFYYFSLCHSDASPSEL